MVDQAQQGYRLDAGAQLARSIAEMEALAAAISHDLKSPLATVAGCVQLLAHLPPSRRITPEYDELLNLIGTSIGTMGALIDDLLAYAAAPEAGLNLTNVDLHELVKEVVSTKIGLLRHLDGPGDVPPIISVGPLPPVLADAVMIRRVVENLIDNAIKYTAPGDIARIRITGKAQPDGGVRIEVADRGIGIPEDQHDAVFVRFHRAHADAGYPGTGLGLAICHRVIERHGGLIGARPNRGGGTRFWFVLPGAGDQEGVTPTG